MITSRFKNVWLKIEFYNESTTLVSETLAHCIIYLIYDPPPYSINSCRLVNVIHALLSIGSVFKYD